MVKYIVIKIACRADTKLKQTIIASLNLIIHVNYLKINSEKVQCTLHDK